MKYKLISTVASVITFLLFATLLLAPQFIFILFGVEGNEAAYFLARRAAMLFLGLAFIAFLSRNAQHSVARQTISLGIACSMMGLALLGIIVLLRGFTGMGILLAVGGELFLAIGYLATWLSNQSKPIHV